MRTPAILSPAAFVLSAFACAASAAPAIQVSRTSVDFSHVARAFASPVQPVYVTNVGDATLEVGGLTLAGSRPDLFVVGGSCTTRPSLAPGEYCRADIVLNSPSVTGTVSATLSIASNAGPALVVGLFGLIDPAYTGVPFIVRVPEYVEFGDRPLGSPSSLAFSFANVIPPRMVPPAGTFTFHFYIASTQVRGPHAADFALTSSCPTLFVGENCVFTVAFTPGQSGLRTAELVVELLTVNGGAGLTISQSLAGVGSMAAATPATVVEYYNETLDHYFITWVPAEQANLDAGNTPTRWMRTGHSFRAYTIPQAGASPVCRYYIPPGLGDSHFFGRGTQECNATGQNNPSFTLESPDFMQTFLPIAGTCPAGTSNVYRVFSNRPDANHRYMTDPAIRAEMVSRGWLAEGDGPDLVVMCAP